MLDIVMFKLEPDYIKQTVKSYKNNVTVNTRVTWTVEISV